MYNLPVKANGDFLIPAEWNMVVRIISNGDYFTESGVANAYIVTPISTTISIASYSDGMEVKFTTSNTNTGSSTINVSALGLKNIKRPDGSVLQAGDIKTNNLNILTYLGGEFFLISYKDIDNATETKLGLVELATQAEVDAGTDTSRVVTPSTLKNSPVVVPDASTILKGIVELAIQSEITTGTDNTRAITPLGLRQAMSNSKGSNGYTKLSNGIIIQWGTGALVSNSGSKDTPRLYFPISFPNAVLSVVLTVRHFDDAGCNAIYAPKSIINSSFIPRLATFSNGGDSYPVYIAIGY